MSDSPAWGRESCSYSLLLCCCVVLPFLAMASASSFTPFSSASSSLKGLQIHSCSGRIASGLVRWACAPFRRTHQANFVQHPQYFDTDGCLPKRDRDVTDRPFFIGEMNQDL